MEPQYFVTLQGLIFLIAAASLGLGVLSAFWPHKSIEWYIWLMARFNWIVKPADEDRELRNTSRFGYLLMALGVVTLVLIMTAL